MMGPSSGGGGDGREKGRTPSPSTLSSSGLSFLVGLLLHTSTTRFWHDGVRVTARNANHIEAQAAAIVRRLQMDGVDVSGAYTVVNRPFICTQGGQGCAPNLPRMLGPDASLTIYPSGGNTAGRNVIIQPEVRTFPRR